MLIAERPEVLRANGLKAYIGERGDRRHAEGFVDEQVTPPERKPQSALDVFGRADAGDEERIRTHVGKLAVLVHRTRPFWRTFSAARNQHSMMFTASPPRAVSLYLVIISAPVCRIVSMTSSRLTF